MILSLYDKKYNKIETQIHSRLDIKTVFCKFMHMQIEDRIYGTVDITDSVLLEIINTRPVRRLRGINQAGASQYVIAGKTVTRFEHSLGVMILLRKLGASIEEQIAGVLHDVPHTAFSHVIDFVFTSDNHEYHEQFHSEIILNSEIPEILKKYGYDVGRILDHRNFPLLERQLPDLCADRIDYAMRDMTASNGYSSSIQTYIDNFIVHDNEIIFKTPGTARKFAEDFLYMDRTRWSHPLEIALFQILAEAIKRAFETGDLSHDDLFQDDNHVLGRLQSSKDRIIQSKLKMLNPSLTIIDEPNDFHFFTRNKVRYVDPKFIGPGGEDGRVSQTYPDFNRILNRHIERVTRGHYIKIVSY